MLVLAISPAVLPISRAELGTAQYQLSSEVVLVTVVTCKKMVQIETVNAEILRKILIIS